VRAVLNLLKIVIRIVLFHKRVFIICLLHTEISFSVKNLHSLFFFYYFLPGENSPCRTRSFLSPVKICRFGTVNFDLSFKKMEFILLFVLQYKKEVLSQVYMRSASWWTTILSLWNRKLSWEMELGDKARSLS